MDLQSKLPFRLAFLASFKLISINAFPATPSQYHAFNVSLFHSSSHDPLILSVLPNSKSFSITNASHLPPRQPPPFPLDVRPTNNEEDQLADSAEGMHLGSQDYYIRDEEPEGKAKFSNVAPEKSKLPLMKGWQVNTENGEDAAGNLITCAMGLGGRVIIGGGSNKSLWVWRYDE